MSPNNTYAVVVGIERYALLDSDLDGPGNDTVRFVEWLRQNGVPAKHILVFLSPLEKNRVELEAKLNKTGVRYGQANRAEIEGCIENLKDAALFRGDLLYLFWGGHGIADEFGNRCLFYADTNEGNLNRHLDLNSWLGLLASYGHLPKQIAYIDSCANLKPHWKLGSIKLPPRPRNAVQSVLFAAGIGQRASNNDLERSGKFSQILHDVITEIQGQGPSWPPDPRRVIEMLRKRFHADPSQTPVFFEAGDFEGNIYKDGQSPNEMVLGPRNNTDLFKVTSRQSADVLLLLAGSAKTSKKYVEEIYEPRVECERLFFDYLASGDGILGIYGDAGMGKTNLAVRFQFHCSERQIPCILLPASQIDGGKLRVAIVDALNSAIDVSLSLQEWERRIQTLCCDIHCPLVVIIDGLDESQVRPTLRQELAIFYSKWTRRMIHLRLIVTCRSESWDWWVSAKDSGEAIGSLVTPHGQYNVSPGYHLGSFSYGERNRAWRRYAAAYNLPGTLPATLSQMCSHPILLRYIADLWRAKRLQPEADFTLSPSMIISRFITSAEANVGHPKIARLILNEIAVSMLEDGSREVRYVDVVERSPVSHNKIGALDRLISESVLIYRRQNMNDSVGFYTELVFQTVAARALLAGHRKRNMEWLCTTEIPAGLEAAVLGIGQECYVMSRGESPEYAEGLLEKMWSSGGPWKSVVAREYMKSTNVLGWVGRIAAANDTGLTRLATEALSAESTQSPETVQKIAGVLENAAAGDYWSKSAIATCLQGVAQRARASKSTEKVRIGLLTWPAYALFEYAMHRCNLSWLEFVNIENTAEKRDALARGTIDLMLGTLDEAVILEAEGIPAAVLMPICESVGADALVGGTQWNDITDLLCRARIGIEETGPGHFLVAQLAMQKGLSIVDARRAWRYLEVYDPCTALLSGTIDAAAVWDPWLTMLRKQYTPGIWISSAAVRPRLLIDILIGRRDRTVPQHLLQWIHNAWWDGSQEGERRTQKAIDWLSSQLAADKDSLMEMLDQIRLIRHNSLAGSEERRKTLEGSWRQCNNIWLYSEVVDRIVDGQLPCATIV